jgi:hypothetical protein
MAPKTAYISVAEASSLWVAQHIGWSSRRYFEDGDHHLIVPDDQVPLFREACPEVIVLPESKFVSSETVSALRLKLESANNSVRHGWYLQQYIKLGALDQLRDAYERLVIWDADGLPLRRVTFFDALGRPKLYSSSEKNQPYFDLIARLAPEVKRQKRSFIAQCLPVTKSQLDDFFDKFGGSADSLVRVLQENIDFSEYCGLSEYELLGNVIYSQSTPIWQPDNRWSRYGNHWIYPHQVGGFVAKGLSLIYDFVSFESSSVSSPEKVRGSIRWLPWRIVSKSIDSLSQLGCHIFGLSESNRIGGDKLQRTLEAALETIDLDRVRVAVAGLERKRFLGLVASISEPESLAKENEKDAPFQAVSSRINSDYRIATCVDSFQTGTSRVCLKGFFMDPLMFKLLLANKPASREIMKSSFSFRAIRRSIVRFVQSDARLRRQLPLFLAFVRSRILEVDIRFDFDTAHSADLMVFGSIEKISESIKQVAEIRPRFVIIAESGLPPDDRRMLESLGYKQSADGSGVTLLREGI